MSRFRPGSTSLCGDTGEPTRFAFHPRDSRDRSGARRLCLSASGHPAATTGSDEGLAHARSRLRFPLNTAISPASPIRMSGPEFGSGTANSVMCR